MSQHFRQKSFKKFQWTFTVPSSYRYNLESEKFRFQDSECYLNVVSLYESQVSVVYFNSDRMLDKPIDIAVVSRGDFKSCSLKNNIKGLREEIFNFSKFVSNIVILDVINLSDNLNECPSYLEKPIHLKALSRDFSNLLKDDPSNFDVAISCQGETFHAHKIVLQARSAVFSSMFKSDMLESNTGLVDVKDIKSSIFGSFLKYLYSGILPKLTVDSAMEFYEVGDLYSVNELKDVCSNFMIENLSNSNACSILVLADMHSDVDFRRKVISYIVENRIPESYKKWLEFCECHCTLANEVLILYIQKHCSK